VRIDIWSDLVCPWCYIGKRRFERALAAFRLRQGFGGHVDHDEVTIVHRSFQLDPRSPRGQTFDRRQMLQQKYGWSTIQAQEMDARMIETAAAEGLEYHLLGGVTGNTMDAHQLVHLGQARGVQDAVVERLYRAHFTEQQSIFDRDSLVALASAAGVDAADARDTLERDAYVDAVAADNAAARALGANGVPFFVIDNRYGVSGAQPVEVFTGALAQAWAAA
jgi:predicted DsbA family dithiol-disulfide isomerase